MHTGIYASACILSGCSPASPPPTSCSSCSAACSSSTDSTSRWSASRCRPSTPTCTSRPHSCSGSSPATCSGTAACSSWAVGPPTCSGGGGRCSSRWASSPSPRPSAGSSTTARCSSSRASSRARRRPSPPRRAFRSSRPRSLRAPSATAPSASTRRPGASGFSLGLVLGGVLTELGWRWTFLLPVPIALALLAIGPRVIPHDRGAALSRRRFDVPGAVTLTTGNAPARADHRRGARPGLGRRRRRRCLRAERDPAVALRRHRATLPRAARAPRHPALELAGAREPRHDDHVRRLRRLPVRDDAVPADAQRLVGDPDRAGLPAGGPARRAALDADRPDRRPHRHVASGRAGRALLRHGLHGDRAARHRHRAVLHPRAPADDAPARPRLRAELPDAQHRRDQRRRRPRAGPCVGARADLVPGRRRDRAGRRQRDHHRSRRQLDRHRRDPRRVPDGAHRRHRSGDRRAWRSRCRAWFRREVAVATAD